MANSWNDIILLAFCKFESLYLTNAAFKTENISLFNYSTYIELIKRKTFLGVRCTLLKNENLRSIFIFNENKLQPYQLLS